MVKSCLLPEASLHGASARQQLAWRRTATKRFLPAAKFCSVLTKRPPTQIIASLTVFPYSAGDSECGRDYDTPL